MTLKIRKIVTTRKRIVLPKGFKEGDIVEIKKIEVKEELDNH